MTEENNLDKNLENEKTELNTEEVNFQDKEEKSSQENEQKQPLPEENSANPLGSNSSNPLSAGGETTVVYKAEHKKKEKPKKEKEKKQVSGKPKNEPKRNYKKYKLTSTILSAIVTGLALITLIIQLVSVLGQDPSQSADGFLVYMLTAIIVIVISLAFYIPSTAMAMLGFIYMLKNYESGDHTGEKVHFGILTFAPLFMEILYILSILIVS
ncbi:MAG: hypothetical protein IJ398_06755 [Clostridia bacterium]|nr:hypothetical protein [Clostridia bacterium]